MGGQDLRPGEWTPPAFSPPQPQNNAAIEYIGGKLEQFDEHLKRLDTFSTVMYQTMVENDPTFAERFEAKRLELDPPPNVQRLDVLESEIANTKAEIEGLNANFEGLATTIMQKLESMQVNGAPRPPAYPEPAGEPPYDEPDTAPRVGTVRASSPAQHIPTRDFQNVTELAKPNPQDEAPQDPPGTEPEKRPPRKKRKPPTKPPQSE